MFVPGGGVVSAPPPPIFKWNNMDYTLSQLSGFFTTTIQNFKDITGLDGTTPLHDVLPVGNTPFPAVILDYLIDANGVGTIEVRLAKMDEVTQELNIVQVMGSGCYRAGSWVTWLDNLAKTNKAERDAIIPPTIPTPIDPYSTIDDSTIFQGKV